MILTGSELIEFLKSCCNKYHKLFIPDPPRQEQVADALASFYKKDNLEMAVDLFVKSRPGPFLVFDFAVESRAFVKKVEFEKKAQDKFKNIVEETRRKLGA
jgi:hypothetical protein